MGGFRCSARTGTIREFLPTIVLIAFAHPAVVAIASIVIKAVTQKEALKILDIGSAVLFGGLALYALLRVAGDRPGLNPDRPAIHLAICPAPCLGRCTRVACASCDQPRLGGGPRRDGRDEPVWLTHPDQRAGRMLLLTVALGYAAFRFTQWYPRYLGLRGPAQPAG